jgi:uncharacterized membrane protein YczE
VVFNGLVGRRTLYISRLATMSALLLAISALIKEGLGSYIWHQATHVDVSGQSAVQTGTVLNWDYFNAVG